MLICVWHRIYSIRSEDEANAKLTNLFVFHTIELPKFLLKAEELTTPLEQWCYFLIHGEELEPTALPTTLQRPPIKKAVEVMEIMSHDTKELELYEDRLKARRDASTEKKVSFQEGKQVGFVEGEAVGVGKGQQLALFESIESYLKAKYGSEALRLSPQLTAIQDMNRLRTLRDAIYLAASIQEIEQLLRKQ